MIYLVKNNSGAEFQVDEELFHTLKGKKDYTCRILGAEPIKPIAKVEYPIKDEGSPWYTLSNGKRVRGEAKANELQKELDG